jgi:hypothetical protein
MRRIPPSSDKRSDNEILSSAREWLREWYRVGKIRNGRRGFILIERIPGAPGNSALMDRLSAENLNEAVKQLISPLGSIKTETALASPERPREGNFLAVDIRKARNLDAQLVHLNAARELSPRAYVAEWYGALREIGGNASVNYTRDGTVQLLIGHACDDQEDERAVRVDALRRHFKQTSGVRDALIAYLESMGQVSDNRTVPIHIVTKAVRSFVQYGGRLTLRPDGEIDHVIDLFPVLDDGVDLRWADGAIDASRTFTPLIRKWSARKRITRIVRRLGIETLSGGIVLSANRASIR